MELEEKEEITKQKEELRKKLIEENKKLKIRNIDYYKEFQIINETDKNMGYKEKDIYIVQKEEKNGIKSYEIYNKNQEKIASTDEKGLLNFDSKYKEQLKEQLKEFYPELGLEDEERKMYLHEHNYVQEGEKEDFISKERGYEVGEKPIEKLSKEEKDKEIEEIRKNRKNNADTIEPTLIQEDLGLDTKDFGAILKIKDKRFYERIPEARDYQGDAMLIYNNKTNKFMIIGMQNGKYVECDSIEPSVGTMKTSIDLDKTGKNVEKQAIGGIMKIKGNNDYDFAVNLEPGGSIEFQQLRKTEDGKYVSADLRTQGQYQTSWEVDKMMDKRKNRRLRDEKEEFETARKHGHKSTVESLRDKECTNEGKPQDNKSKRKEDDDEEWERGHRRDPRWNL